MRARLQIFDWLALREQALRSLAKDEAGLANVSWIHADGPTVAEECACRAVPAAGIRRLRFMSPFGACLADMGAATLRPSVSSPPFRRALKTAGVKGPHLVNADELPSTENRATLLRQA